MFHDSLGVHALVLNADTVPPPRQVVAKWGRARSSRMTLPHYTALTPMFMPVGTQGVFCEV